jgi:hypothetical protein
MKSLDAQAHPFGHNDGIFLSSYRDTVVKLECREGQEITDEKDVVGFHDLSRSAANIRCAVTEVANSQCSKT